MSWLLLVGATLSVLAEPDTSSERIATTKALCPMIEAAAHANGLPVGFFVRLVWRESRFRPDAIGPVTRSGARAQGIAQFMPATALERNLFEPFNPEEALPKSGQFLAELRDRFGNLGLAAAAYNAGPQRVQDFITNTRGLPAETRNYVLAVTGLSAEDWVKPEKVKFEQDGPTTCQDFVATARQPQQQNPSRFAISLASILPRRIVPGWCAHLNNPKASVCGTPLQRSAKIATQLQFRR
jgi:hypothetical protein